MKIKHAICYKSKARSKSGKIAQVERKVLNKLLNKNEILVMLKALIFCFVHTQTWNYGELNLMVLCNTFSSRIFYRHYFKVQRFIKSCYNSWSSQTRAVYGFQDSFYRFTSKHTTIIEQKWHGIQHRPP